MAPSSSSWCWLCRRRSRFYLTSHCSTSHSQIVFLELNELMRGKKRYKCHTQRFKFLNSSVATVTLLTLCLFYGLYAVVRRSDLWGLRPQVICVNVVLCFGPQLLPTLLEPVLFILKELPSHLPEDQSSWFGAVSSRYSYDVSVVAIIKKIYPLEQFLRKGLFLETFHRLWKGVNVWQLDASKTKLKQSPLCSPGPMWRCERCWGLARWWSLDPHPQ